MVHYSVEQGHNKYSSFLSLIFIVRADTSGTGILILLSYFKGGGGIVLITQNFERA